MGVLGLVSPNFSGSTVAGAILEGFENVAHVGEVWKTRSEKQEKKAFCRECGPDQRCPRFTTDFIRRLRSVDIEKFWGTCLAGVEADWIVTGDKNPKIYERFTGFPDRFLVLVKNPIAAALSYSKRYMETPEKTDDSISFLEGGLRIYYSKLKERYIWVKKTGVPFSFCTVESLFTASREDLTIASEVIFGSVLGWDHSRIKSKMHYIGGNHKISRGKDADYFGGLFLPDYRYRKEVDLADQVELVNRYIRRYNFNEFLDDNKEVVASEWLKGNEVDLIGVDG
ncbi:MAG: hypothetical protein JJT90_15710 [Ectothiorhodospiraceae bacterium]|nr:hypothetical protein [Ectothiorhodospiraceae bacterium]